MPLFLVEENQTYIIRKITGDKKVKQRLEALGLVENKKIFLLSHTSQGCIVLINDSRLALDKDITKNIMV